MSSLKWNSVEWPRVEQRVFRYQSRIYRASLEGKRNVVKYLQQRLITSLDSKLLAVRKVTTENKGRNTAGVDKKLYDSPEKKIKLAKSLKLDGKAKPIRRVEIPKPGRPGQKRPLGIPTVVDRAKQQLCKLALEPEWEAVFEAESYGFRPGRSCHDAIESAFAALANKKRKPEFRKMVLKVDIEKCFDKINHELLLEKLDNDSIITKQIEAWLRAGVMKGFSRNTSLESLIKNEMGTPQGGIILPLLSNIALHGLINHLKTWIVTIPAKNNRTASKQEALKVIRYADDILVMHKDKKVIKMVRQEIKEWLWQNCRLTLNQEKTKITDSTQGFTFLGFMLITYNRNGVDRVKILPTRESQARILLNLREDIQRNKSASSYQLITILRPKIIGWGNYYRYCECKKVFTRISHFIFQKLRAWSFRIDKRHGRQKVKEKYFPSDKTFYFENRKYEDNWTLCGKTKDKDGVVKENFLPKLSWIKSKKWVKVKGNKSPFDGGHVYWARRLSNYRRLPTRTTKLLKVQNGICPLCRTRFQLDSVMEIDHITPKELGGKDQYSNLQLLHRHCHIKKTRIDRNNITQVKLRRKKN
jgi:RNA-directed DNA polymerase